MLLERITKPVYTEKKRQDLFQNHRVSLVKVQGYVLSIQNAVKIWSRFVDFSKWREFSVVSCGGLLDFLESIHVHLVFFSAIFDAIKAAAVFDVLGDASLEVNDLEEAIKKIVGDERVNEWITDVTMPARPPLAYFVLAIASYHRQNGVALDDMHGVWLFCSACVIYLVFFSSLWTSCGAFFLALTSLPYNFVGRFCLQVLVLMADVAISKF